MLLFPICIQHDARWQQGHCQLFWSNLLIRQVWLAHNDTETKAERRVEGWHLRRERIKESERDVSFACSKRTSTVMCFHSFFSQVVGCLSITSIPLRNDEARKGGGRRSWEGESDDAWQTQLEGEKCMGMEKKKKKQQHAPKHRQSVRIPSVSLQPTRCGQMDATTLQTDGLNVYFNQNKKVWHWDG